MYSYYGDTTLKPVFGVLACTLSHTRLLDIHGVVCYDLAGRVSSPVSLRRLGIWLRSLVQ